MKLWYEPYRIINQNQNATVQTSANEISKEIVELRVTVKLPTVCVPKKITLIFPYCCEENRMEGNKSKQEGKPDRSYGDCLPRWC